MVNVCEAFLHHMGEGMSVWEREIQKKSSVLLREPQKCFRLQLCDGRQLKPVASIVQYTVGEQPFVALPPFRVRAPVQYLWLAPR